MISAAIYHFTLPSTRVLALILDSCTGAVKNCGLPLPFHWYHSRPEYHSLRCQWRSQRGRARGMALRQKWGKKKNCNEAGARSLLELALALPKNKTNLFSSDAFFLGGEAGRVKMRKNPISTPASRQTPLWELMTLPQIPYRLERGYPLSIPLPLDAFGVLISAPNEHRRLRRIGGVSLIYTNSWETPASTA